MQLAIVIAVAVIVIALAVVLVVRGARTRSARSDWIGELSEIRRSSLGDDEEVTGAMEAVTIVDDPPTEPDAGTTGDGADSATPAPDPDDTVAARPVTDQPVRTIDDAGTRFNEYGGPDASRLRVELTGATGLRVVATTGSDDDSFAVDLPQGILWFHTASKGPASGCSVRIPAGWVTADGVLAVLADEQGWSYAMCIGGTASVRSRAGGNAVRLVAGQIGRVRVGHPGVDLVEVGVDALESEGIVRRQRRLDTARGHLDAAAPSESRGSTGGRG